MPNCITPHFPFKHSYSLLQTQLQQLLLQEAFQPSPVKTLFFPGLTSISLWPFPDPMKLGMSLSRSISLILGVPPGQGLGLRSLGTPGQPRAPKRGVREQWREETLRWELVDTRKKEEDG